MQNIKIERGNKEDLKAIVELNHRIFKPIYLWEPYSREQYETRLSDVEAHILLAKDEDRLIGDAIAFEREGEFYCWIMAVHQRYRRQGVGKEFITKIDEEAKSRGMPVSAKVYSSSPEMSKLLFMREYGLMGIEPAEGALSVMHFRKDTHRVFR